MSRPAWVGLDEAQPSGGPAAEPGVNDYLREELGEPSETLRLSHRAAASVDAYIEYKRVVGDADGGVLFTDAQYAAFRAKAAAARGGGARLYASWRNSAGLDCKSVGPATLCECGHRYREHATDSLAGARHAKDVHCNARGCRCPLFAYLPSAGAWAAKCGCRHSAAEHDPRSKACTRCSCSAFAATFSCGCGAAWAAHATALETRAERVAAGRPVDNLLGGGEAYEALGGITSFASLADGYERAAIGDGGALPAPLDESVTASRAATPPAGDALAKLKAARAAARTPHAAIPPAPARPVAALAAPLPPAASEAASWAAKRRAAAERASELARERRERAAAEAAAQGPPLSELDQLHLSWKR